MWRITEEKEEAADVEHEELILIIALVVEKEEGEGAGELAGNVFETEGGGRVGVQGGTFPEKLHGLGETFKDDVHVGWMVGLGTICGRWGLERDFGHDLVCRG